MPKLRCPKGFSLVELLVVMTLSLTVLSLVGGVTLNAIRRAEAQAELTVIYNLIKKVGVMSFATGRTLVLTFDADRASVVGGDEILTEKSFDHLRFERQKVTFNRNGFPDSFKLAVNVQGQLRVIDLTSLSGGFPIDVNGILQDVG